MHPTFQQMATSEGSSVMAYYGNRLRIRVCGICWRNESLLMVNHKSLSKGDLWAVPGGGVDFGQTMEEALKNEFLEETGLFIRVKRLICVCEFVQLPLHAIELFFEVEVQGGELIKGIDPEMPMEHQIIEEVKFLEFAEILKLPIGERHGIFNHVTMPEDLKKLTGIIKI